MASSAPVLPTNLPAHRKGNLCICVHRYYQQTYQHTGAHAKHVAQLASSRGGKFERMNMVFDEIRDRMDKQDAAIANLQEGRPQRVPNARRQERRELINDFDDNLGNEIEDEEDQVSMGDMDKFMQKGGRH
ncbi:hypothetical protein QYF36_015534 [Acer negundo]|nr:hypothetical protein QYF36_015534 [Acer negundo]